MAMSWEEAMDKRNKRKAAKVKSHGTRAETAKHAPEYLMVRKYYTGSENAFELISSKTLKSVSRGYDSEESAREAIPLIFLK